MIAPSRADGRVASDWAGLSEPFETDFAWWAVRIGPDAVAAARRLAYADGRVIERDGFALLTWGEAFRIGLPSGLCAPEAARHASARLSALRPFATERAPVEASPVAIGALAFAPDGASELVVPSIAVIAQGDLRVAVGVAAGDDMDRLLAGFPFAAVPTPEPSEHDEPPDSFTLTSVRTHEDFRRRVEHAVATVRSGALTKVVLAREVAVSANRPLRQHHLLERLRALHPSCCAFAVDGFIGASPELLLRRSGCDLASQPLAGTVARSGDPDEDRHLAATLLASTKERSEHGLVVDAILDALAPHCATLFAPETPHLLALRNVAHLATSITGTLATTPTGEIPSALELVAELHPTPAVGGVPRDAALDYLRHAEDLDRGRYAGPVGWVDANGDGEWWIGIRSAIVTGCTARLFAGVGIVAGSDPFAELRETQLKLQALLAAAVRP